MADHSDEEPRSPAEGNALGPPPPDSTDVEVSDYPRDDRAVEFLPNEVIEGQFEVVRRIGKGGMGVVHEVVDRITGKRRALKVILPSVLTKPGTADRFIREVTICQDLRDPGIVAVHHVGKHLGLPFFTMEYVDGKSVRQLLAERGALPLQEAVSILGSLCDALDYAHQFTVHRDVSPENVMVLPNGATKLLDFGLAKAVDGETWTVTRAVMGKYIYMSPEQLRDAKNVDRRADIYSLGIMFFEMVIGEIPTPCWRPTDVVAGLPAQCDEVVAKALAAVGRRFETAGAFKQALEAIPGVAEFAGTVTLGALQVGGLPGVGTAVGVIGEGPEMEAGRQRSFAGMEFIWVPPGTFMMGSPEDQGGGDEHPQHEVTISRRFWLGKYTVTKAQWKEVMRSEPWKGKEYVLDDPESPAVYVSWQDAQGFCQKLGAEFGLPTEAQWEYACRAGSETGYWFGDDEKKLGDYAWYGGNARNVAESYAHIVGQKKPNRWGLYDMHGNVREWCQDWYAKDYYRKSPARDPMNNAKSAYRVLRGGSWDYNPWNCRSADRSYNTPGSRNEYLGFRLSRTP